MLRASASKYVPNTNASRHRGHIPSGDSACALRVRDDALNSHTT